MNEMMFCKKCKRFRAHFDYEELYQCIGCKSKIMKEVAGSTTKTKKMQPGALLTQQDTLLRRVGGRK